MRFWRLVALVSGPLFLLVLPGCLAIEQRPLILIYTPDAPGFGHELASILQEDGRMNSKLEIVESPEVFKVALALPNVKAVVVAPSLSLSRGIGPALEWFFSQGGGLVGMGFAGAKQTTGNASEKVFPLFGNSMRTGKYDPKTKSFVMKFVKEEDDEISHGLSDFVVSTQKIVLSYNGTANSYLPRRPETGDYKVLYREESTGAPAVVKYQAEGVSVTFACFGGDDFERGVNYYGRFSRSEEFRTLFSNSVYWVWTNEKKYDGAMKEAEQFYANQPQMIRDARQRGEELEKRDRRSRQLRSLVTVVVALVASALVYWGTFLRGRQEGS